MVSVVFIPREAWLPSGHQSVNEPPPTVTVSERVAPGLIIGVVVALRPGPEIDRRCAILPALCTTRRTVPFGRLLVEGVMRYSRSVTWTVVFRTVDCPARAPTAAPASARATTRPRAMLIRFTTSDATPGRAKRFYGGIGGRGAVSPGHAGRRAAASSVAPIENHYRGSPASLPRDDHRTQSASQLPPSPPYAAVAAAPADCSSGGSARSIRTLWPRRQRNTPCRRSRSRRPAKVEPVEPSAASSSAHSVQATVNEAAAAAISTTCLRSLMTRRDPRTSRSA